MFENGMLKHPSQVFAGLVVIAVVALSVAGVIHEWQSLASGAAFALVLFGLLRLWDVARRR
jgi:hypothetical protein